VLEDLRKTAPDLILHGGDLADGGSSPGEIVDQIRDLGWPGVMGNTDEMLIRPDSLTEFATQSPKLQPLFDVVKEMAEATRERLGEDRIAWLRSLPRAQHHGVLAVVHGSPDSPWSAPALEASNEELQSIYGRLGAAIAVHGHIHRPYIRNIIGMTIVNSGSISLSYDGDPRASYLLLDDSTPTIRRISYNLDREIRALQASAMPHADWIARILKSATFVMP